LGYPGFGVQPEQKKLRKIPFPVAGGPAPRERAAIAQDHSVIEVGKAPRKKIIHPYIEPLPGKSKQAWGGNRYLILGEFLVGWGMGKLWGP